MPTCYSPAPAVPASGAVFARPGGPLAANNGHNGRAPGRKVVRWGGLTLYIRDNVAHLRAKRGETELVVLDDAVDDLVVDRFFGRHEVVAFGVLGHLVERLAGVL